MEPRDYIEYKDQNGRVYFSTLVHWRHAGSAAHCLMQAVFVPGSQLKIFLAQLKTCPRWRGIFFDPEGAANAAWHALKEHFGDLTHLDVDWIFHSGQFSSYDYGVPAGISRYHLTPDAQEKWHHKKYDAVSLSTEEKAQLIKLTNIPEVTDDLEKLSKMPPLDPQDC